MAPKDVSQLCEESEELMQSFGLELSLKNMVQPQHATSNINEDVLRVRNQGSQMIIRHSVKKTVQFSDRLVSHIYYRPYTTRQERNELFYQIDDYKKFKKENRSYLDEEDAEVEFSILTAAFSVFLALLLFLVYSVSLLERYILKSGFAKWISETLVPSLVDGSTHVVRLILQLDDDMVSFRTL